MFMQDDVCKVMKAVTITNVIVNRGVSVFQHWVTLTVVSYRQAWGWVNKVSPESFSLQSVADLRGSINKLHSRGTTVISVWYMCIISSVIIIHQQCFINALLMWLQEHNWKLHIHHTSVNLFVMSRNTNLQLIQYQTFNEKLLINRQYTGWDWKTQTLANNLIQFNLYSTK